MSGMIKNYRPVQKLADEIKIEFVTAEWFDGRIQPHRALRVDRRFEAPNDVVVIQVSANGVVASFIVAIACFVELKFFGDSCEQAQFGIGTGSGSLSHSLIPGGEMDKGEVYISKVKTKRAPTLCWTPVVY